MSSHSWKTRSSPAGFHVTAKIWLIILLNEILPAFSHFLFLNSQEDPGRFSFLGFFTETAKSTQQTEQ